MCTTEEENGNRVRWAIAIKNISSRVGQTIFDNVRRASEQINAATCSADRGIVLLAARGSIDHERLWAAPFPTVLAARDALSQELRGLAALADKDRLQEDWEAAFVGKTSPLFLLTAQAVVRVESESGPVPTILKMALEHNPLERPDPQALMFARCLNEFMQTVVKGIPGSVGKFPE
jgi:hypothetical protein